MKHQLVGGEIQAPPAELVQQFRSRADSIGRFGLERQQFG